MKINQKVIQRILLTIQKILEAIYFFGSLWIGIILICTIPIWAPLYLLTTSISRSLGFIKRLIQLPQQIFHPKFTELIRYAILKGNGKYLRNITDEEDVFLYQLYDYTLRSIFLSQQFLEFLSVQQINPQTKIAEIQCETLSQWKYFKTNNGIKSIKCLQSKPEILDKQKQLCPSFDFEIKRQNYHVEEFSNQYDTIIALNIKQKLNKHLNQEKSNQSKVDVLKVLGYIKHHLNQNGYAVFGDFFQEQGQVKVLEELFSVYGFRIEQSQNIQKNISYSEKLLEHKTKKYWEEQLLQKFIKKLKKVLKIKRDYTNKFFVVFILTKNKPINQNSSGEIQVNEPEPERSWNISHSNANSYSDIIVESSED